MRRIKPPPAGGEKILRRFFMKVVFSQKTGQLIELRLSMAGGAEIGEFIDRFRHGLQEMRDHHLADIFTAQAFGNAKRPDSFLLSVVVEKAAHDDVLGVEGESDFLTWCLYGDILRKWRNPSGEFIGQETPPGSKCSGW
jgi:hypothetical protein